MEATFDHNAVLKRVARARLEPLGIVQKGRSRTWLDDRTWFVTVVEFQPSGFDKGSYLNVGASWIWWPGKDFLSFDEGSRIHGLESASDGNWEATCGGLADEAAQRCLEIRKEFPDIWTTSARLNRHNAALSFGGWDTANAGVAAALAGDAALARRRLQTVTGIEATRDWERDYQRAALRLLDELGDLDRFREERIADIQRARKHERLPGLEDAAIRVALMSRPHHGDRALGLVTRFGGLRRRG